MAISTKNPGNNDIDDKLVVVGRIDVRKTHPNLYWLRMLLAIVCVLLGLNFLVSSLPWSWAEARAPTFLIYGMPPELWGATFLLLGATELLFLNVWRRLKPVRLCLSSSVFLFFAVGVGTCQPFYDGEGSLQLPIFYFALMLLHLPVIVEPFINPWMAARDEP